MVYTCHHFYEKHCAMSCSILTVSGLQKLLVSPHELYASRTDSDLM